MSNRIEKIVLKNFKGAANTLDLEIDNTKTIVLIYGENGSGKSTIIDAIDFVCNERFGSISDRSVGKGVADFIPTIGKTKNQMEVSIRTHNGTWTGTIGAKSAPSISGPMVNKPNVEILRRSKILSIVTAEPKDRYTAIKDFIEVPICDSNEKSLRDAEKLKRKTFEDSVKAISEAESSLRTLWEKNGKPEVTEVLWAEKTVSFDLTELDRGLNDLETITVKLATCSFTNDALIRTGTEYDFANQEYRDAKNAFNNTISQYAEDIDSLIDVLTKAKNYLSHNANATACPVCERPIVPDSLSIRINERLDAIQEQVRSRERMKKAKTTLDSKEQLLKTKQKDYRNAVIDLKEIILTTQLPLITNLNLDSDLFTKLSSGSDDIDSESICWSNQLYSAVYGIRDSLLLEKQKMNDTKGKHSELKHHLDTIKEKTASAHELEKVLKCLSTLLSLVEGERKKYVDELLRDIADEVELMYSAVHPAEGLGNIRWYLNPKYQGSLEFEGQFQSATNVPPTAYYSESHLDTLGICVFLALAKHKHIDDTIIILDDIVTSVDQVHMERFFRMLNNQAEAFSQIIVGTHYRPWRDKYRYYTGSGSNVQLIELQHWSLARGIRHTKTKFVIDDLRDTLNADPVDRQIIASKAGILLEAMLDRMGRQFQCKLPLKNDPDYTLSEYAGGFNSKLKKLLRIENIKDDGSIENIECGIKLEACTEQSWVRNQVGCHFNVSGMNISDVDVEDFAKNVLEFSSNIICDDCGEYPSNNKSGSFWQCKCGKNRLFPLISPQ